MATEADLHAALFDLEAAAVVTVDDARAYLLLADAITELLALRARCAELARLVDALRRQLAGGAYGG